MSFINVLEQILDCTNLVANLNIDVRIDTLSTPRETQMQEGCVGTLGWD
jgi:hypothetical protein